MRVGIGIGVPPFQAGGALWTPEVVATVDAWVKAKSGTSWGEVGPAWDARVSGERPTYGATLLNGNPGLDFEPASSQNLLADLSSLSSGTTHHLFWALDLEAVGTAGVPSILRAGSLNLIVYMNNPSGKLGFYDGTHRTSTQAPSTGVQVVELQLDGGGGTGQFYIDGSAVGGSLTYSPAAINQTGVGLMSNNAGTGGFIDGVLGHFVHSTAILTGSDLTLMRAFLAESIA